MAVRYYGAAAGAIISGGLMLALIQSARLNSRIAAQNSGKLVLETPTQPNPTLPVQSAGQSPPGDGNPFFNGLYPHLPWIPRPNSDKAP